MYDEVGIKLVVLFLPFLLPLLPPLSSLSTLLSFSTLLFFPLYSQTLQFFVTNTFVFAD